MKSGFDIRQLWGWRAISKAESEWIDKADCGTWIKCCTNQEHPVNKYKKGSKNGHRNRLYVITRMSWSQKDN